MGVGPRVGWPSVGGETSRSSPGLSSYGVGNDYSVSAPAGPARAKPDTPTRRPQPTTPIDDRDRCIPSSSTLETAPTKRAPP